MEENKEKPTEKELLLKYLQEVLSFESQKLVGKICKRLEIIEDREILKKELRELVYESFRDQSDIFQAYAKGLEMSFFKFVKPSKKE